MSCKSCKFDNFSDVYVQLVNLGSSYKYDGGAEFLCVVSRQCPSMQNGHYAEATDRGKVSFTACLYLLLCSVLLILMSGHHKGQLFFKEALFSIRSFINVGRGPAYSGPQR